MLGFGDERTRARKTSDRFPPDASYRHADVKRRAKKQAYDDLGAVCEMLIHRPLGLEARVGTCAFDHSYSSFIIGGSEEVRYGDGW
jgi:hypothetical protein